MNASGITPLDHKVLVLPDPSEEVSKGGIIIPETTRDKNKFATMKATLLAAGRNAFTDWARDENNMPVRDSEGFPIAGARPGARILMAQYAGARTKGADGSEYILMNDEDVVAVLEEPANV